MYTKEEQRQCAGKMPKTMVCILLVRGLYNSAPRALVDLAVRVEWSNTRAIDGALLAPTA